MKKITYYKWKEGFASSFLWDLNPTPFEDILENWDIDNGQLLRLIEDHFSLEEINTLAFELDIDYEKLPGQDKTSKVRELIKHCDRRGTLRNLLLNARRRRPNADWKSCLCQYY